MKIIIHICTFCFYLFSLTAFAQSITLYDQPNATAKNIGTIDLSAGIIPIFTPKPGDWVKVADPRNGNVGWVKVSDVKSAKESGSSVSYSQNIIQTNSQNPQAPQKLTAEQQEWVKKVQTEQLMMQQKLQHMLNDMNEMFKQEWETLKANPQFPTVLPFLAAPPPTNKTNAPAPSTVAPNNQTQPATEIKNQTNMNNMQPAH